MENSKMELSKKQERLNNLENEEFYFTSFSGSMMPNYTKYDRITMFNDIFYIENELESKEYIDIFSILKIKELIKNNLEKLERMDKRKSGKLEYPKSSYAYVTHVKIDNKVYSIDKYLLDEEEQKEYDDFTKEVYNILGIKDERSS